MSLGAALAFYTALSLAPLLVIVLALAGFLWQEEQVRAELIRQVCDLVGPGGAVTVATIMREAGRNNARKGPMAVVGFVTLLFGATAVFAQLQHSLNRCVERGVAPRPRRRRLPPQAPPVAR
ncbi:MAG: YhjD/YihY/BrkB family envelope integrity protein [Polyangiaceae bacterium]